MVCPFQKLHNVLLRLPFHDLSACLDLAFLRPLISLKALLWYKRLSNKTGLSEQSKQQFNKRSSPQDLRQGPYAVIEREHRLSTCYRVSHEI